MKQKAKRLSAFVLALAIILSLTACSDNNTSVTSGTSINESGNESVDNSEGTSESNSDKNENATAQNTPNKVNDALPQCDPANLEYFVIMKGKEGYYYQASIKKEENEYFSGLGYFDNATGKTIPLCAKPQCVHEGSDFCTATGGMTHFDKDIFYNGYIYRLGAKYNGNEYIAKLLRADMRGSELSTVSDIYSGVLDEGGFHPHINDCVVAHYGKLFFSNSTYEGKKQVHQLFMVDLESGESKRIYLPEPENNAIRLYSHYLNFMTADGDWLYYNSREVIFDKPGAYDERNMLQDRTVLYRFNIRTGETETISAMPDIYSSFTVNNGIIYYTVADRSDNVFSLYSYDIANDKTTTIIDKRQQEYVDGKYVSSGYKVTVLTDRKYLYVCTMGASGMYRVDRKADDTDFYIYDLQGNELMDGLPGLETLLDKEKEWTYEFYALDGEIYFGYHDSAYWPSHRDEDKFSGMYTIKTEDLINGSRDWTKLYYVN